MSSLHHIRLFYAAYFGAMGMILPFLPVYLKERGISVVAVGLCMGLLSLSKVIAPPMAGRILDGMRQPASFIPNACLLAALCSVALVWTHTVWELAFVLFVFGLLWAAVLPITDGLSLVMSENKQADYGRLRVWGSIGFIVVTLISGAWLAKNHLQQFPWWLALLMLVMALASRGFPIQTGISSDNAHHNGNFSSAFFTLLGVSFIMQASHGAYYGFYSLHLLNLGYTGWQIASFWVLGVGAEIILMWLWNRPFQQAAPAWVLSVCLLIAALRWWGIAAAEHWWMLAGLQLLHAASFAAFHVNAIRWTRILAPAHRHATAQGLYSASGFGMGTATGITLCGWIIGWASGDFSMAFFVCGSIAFIGIPIAMKLPRKRVAVMPQSIRNQ